MSRVLDPVSGAIDAAVAGAGSTVLVAGERGSGRTHAARASAASARAAGLRVLEARTGGVALGVPFEVVMDLLGELAGRPEDDPLFAGAAAEAGALVRGQAFAGDEAARNRIIHAVSWVVRRLAEQAPVALVVDDADLADDASARCLEYLAARTAGVALVLVATTGTQAEGRPAELRADLAAAAGARVARLRPLDAAAAAPLFEQRGLPRADAAFRRACVRLSGGDAGLLADLLDEVVARRIEPRAPAVAALEGLEAPPGVRRTVTARLRRLGPGAAAVLDAVFVLAGDATPARVARVAGVTDDEARVHVDALAAANLVRPGEPLRARSPLVQAALAAAPASGARGAMRGRAADLLLDESVPLQRVASHVHGAEPGSARAAVETLVAAAREELVAGRLDRAERHLRRLLDETAAGPLAAEVRLLLVSTQVALEREGARERFDAALAARLPEERAAAWSALGDVLLATGRRRAAAEAFRHGAQAAPDGDPARGDLLGAFAAVARDLPGLAAAAQEVIAELVAPAAAAAALPAPVAIVAAVDATFRGRPRAGAAQLARAALEAVLRDGGDPAEAARCVSVLMWCDELEAAEDAAARLQATGAVPAAVLAPHRAWLHLVRGRLAEATRVLRDAPDTDQAAVTTAAVLAFTRMELGDLQGAAAALSALDDRHLEERGLDVHLLDARGWVQLRTGDATGARRTFDRALDLARVTAIDNPAVARGWFGSAATLQRLGELAQARALTEEALRRVQAFGAPRAQAAALRAAAALESDRAAAVARLARAVELLDGVDAPLDRARALLAYGSLLNRDGRRPQGRDRLREAMDLAHRHGATVLAGRAMDELRAAGGRPRRAQLRGVGSLTPAERQVAEHAASGLSNREIAAVLYVTPKTVEWHLRNVFMKLDVQDRRRLPAALVEDVPLGLPTRRAG